MRESSFVRLESLRGITAYRVLRIPTLFNAFFRILDLGVVRLESSTVVRSRIHLVHPRWERWERGKMTLR